ncbi:MAG: JAB domain-containing protein [Clostridia bacterium]|nr:JAB domain-containing protein [Clostridia bacterium]
MITLNVLSNLLFSAGFKDADETASALFERYHTLDGVLAADAEALTEQVGERAAVLIKLTAALIARRAYDKFTFGVRHLSEEIIELLVALFRGRSVETLFLISMDKNGAVVSCDPMSEGTINATSILPRQLLERAVKNRAKSVIIAHNHPRGIETPSEEDMIFTSSVKSTLECAGIELSAHYVVAGSRVAMI